MILKEEYHLNNHWLVVYTPGEAREEGDLDLSDYESCEITVHMLEDGKWELVLTGEMDFEGNIDFGGPWGFRLNGDQDCCLFAKIREQALSIVRPHG